MQFAENPKVAKALPPGMLQVRQCLVALVLKVKWSMQHRRV